jgi:hypothetical protein
MPPWIPLDQGTCILEFHSVLIYRMLCVQRLLEEVTLQRESWVKESFHRQWPLLHRERDVRSLSIAVLRSY